MFNVLFVCTENTCRSPLAEYILKHLLSSMGVKNIGVKSCGIAVSPSSKLADNSRKVLKELGINVRFRSKQIDEKLIKNADLILTMTLEHKINLSLKYDILDKLFTFAEFTGGVDIPDPYGGNLGVYEKTANLIYNNCILLIKKLIKQGIING